MHQIIQDNLLHEMRDLCASMNIMGSPTFDMTKWIEQKGRIILSISFSCFLTFFKDHHLTVVDIHTVYAYWRPYFEYISYVCTWTQSRMMLLLCSKQKVYIPKTNKNDIQLINKLKIVTFFSHHLKYEFIPRNDLTTLKGIQGTYIPDSNNI